MKNSRQLLTKRLVTVKFGRFYTVVATVQSLNELNDHRIEPNLRRRWSNVKREDTNL